MHDRRRVRFRVNGEEHDLDLPVRRTLADVLRHDIGLTGTHLGCEHGVCGACTVVLDGDAVRSCLLFGVQVDGCQVETVEGLARDGALHPLQEAFSATHGLQCGFCTPGFLMLAKAYLDANPHPDPAEIREVLSSNLCRCTGYQGIVEAVSRVAAAGAEA